LYSKHKIEYKKIQIQSRPRLNRDEIDTEKWNIKIIYSVKMANFLKSFETDIDSWQCSWIISFLKFSANKAYCWIRSEICHHHRSHFRSNRKIEHEILHISVYLVFLLHSEKKNFQEPNSLWGSITFGHFE